jgi:hypothetical protein
MRTLQLDCPGIAIRIRSEPHFGAHVTGLLKSESIVDVCDDTVNGKFYELADGSGFVITGDDGISWHELPPEEPVVEFTEELSMKTEMEGIVSQVTEISTPQASRKNVELCAFDAVIFASTPPSQQSHINSFNQINTQISTLSEQVNSINSSNGNTLTSTESSPSVSSLSSSSPATNGSLRHFMQTTYPGNHFSPNGAIKKIVSSKSPSDNPATLLTSPTAAASTSKPPTTPTATGIAALTRTDSGLSNQSGGSKPNSASRQRNLSISSATNDITPSFAYTQVRVIPI